MQQRYCKFRERCYSGTAPTLSEVSTAFGENVAHVWVQGQIKDLSEYIGAKDKITIERVIELSCLITQNYYYLKLTELMIFFNDVKLGRYGEFYGAFDALKFMSMLGRSMEARIVELDAIEKAAREKERMQKYEESKINSVSYAEYLKTKELAEKGDLQAQEELKPPNVKP